MIQTEISAQERTEKAIELYGDMVYRLALVRTRNKSDAEDVFQEVFLRFFKNVHKINPGDHEKHWLIRAAVNCGNSLLSSAWYKRTEPFTETAVFDSTEDMDVYSAVLKLPQKYRTVVHLFYFEDLSVRRIAEILDLNESAVKTRLRRAREKLKEELKGEYDYG